jgi:hypothetical protein
MGRSQTLKWNISDREVTTMVTLPTGILLLGLGVLGLAVATAIHDTWWLQRQVKETADSQESLRKAA